MKLTIAMSITQSNPFTTWRAATAKAVAEAKAAGHETANVLRCMRTELDAQLAQLPAPKASA